MLVELIKISSLMFDPKNARLHGARSLDAARESLTKFGQQKPLVVDKNNKVVAGNGLLEAAVSLGWTEISIVRTSLTGKAAIAYAIADNRVAELSEWDMESLDESMRELDAELRRSTGFDEAELGKIIKDFDGAAAEVWPAEASEDRPRPTPQAPVFIPSTSPSFDARPVTAENVAAAESREATRFDATPSIRRMVCPRCAHAYEVSA